MKKQITARTVKYVTAQQAFAAGVGLKETSKVYHKCHHWHTHPGYIRKAQMDEMGQQLCPKCEKAARKISK